MKKYVSGDKVGYGLYFSGLHFSFVGADGESLEGEGKSYVRLPMWLMILVSPILGGIFVMSFPLLVTIIVMVSLGDVLMKKAREALSKHSHWAILRWEPTAAYLSKKGKR